MNALKKVFETVGAAISNEKQEELVSPSIFYHLDVFLIFHFILQLREIIAKYNSTFSDSLMQGAKTALDAMEDNKTWRDKNLATVTRWFEKQPEVYPNNATKLVQSILLLLVLIFNIVFIF